MRFFIFSSVLLTRLHDIKICFLRSVSYQSSSDPRSCGLVKRQGIIFQLLNSEAFL